MGPTFVDQSRQPIPAATAPYVVTGKVKGCSRRKHPLYLFEGRALIGVWINVVNTVEGEYGCIEKSAWKRQIRGVHHCEVRARHSIPRGPKQVARQIDTRNTIAEPDKLRRCSPRATSNVENPSGRRRKME